MVSQRCKLSVKDALEETGAFSWPDRIGRGRIAIGNSAVQLKRLKIDLLTSGLEILEDHRSILLEK